MRGRLDRRVVARIRSDVTGAVPNGQAREPSGEGVPEKIRELPLPVLRGMPDGSVHVR
jgi:hypothetical protein